YRSSSPSGDSAGSRPTCSGSPTEGSSAPASLPTWSPSTSPPWATARSIGFGTVPAGPPRASPTSTGYNTSRSNEPSTAATVRTSLPTQERSSGAPRRHDPRERSVSGVRDGRRIALGSVHPPARPSPFAGRAAAEGTVAG